MALSEAQLRSIERARLKVAESAHVITRTYFGEEFEFRFLPTLSQPALEIVAEVQTLANADANIAEMFRNLIAFMDAMATTETAELIAELARAGAMTVNDLVDLQQTVVELVADRPTTRSSSSESGLPSPGPTSTASAPLAASTPLV